MTAVSQRLPTPEAREEAQAEWCFRVARELYDGKGGAIPGTVFLLEKGGTSHKGRACDFLLVQPYTFQGAEKVPVPNKHWSVKIIGQTSAPHAFPMWEVAGVNHGTVAIPFPLDDAPTPPPDVDPPPPPPPVDKPCPLAGEVAALQRLVMGLVEQVTSTNLALATLQAKHDTLQAQAAKKGDAIEVTGEASVGWRIRMVSKGVLQ